MGAPTTAQAILEALRGRAEGDGDAFDVKNGKVTIRCFKPDAHKNGDAHPSAIYTFGKYVVCKVCGFKEGERKLAERLGVDPDILPGGLTLEELAEAKGLPVHFLAAWGWRTQQNRNTRRDAVLVPWYTVTGLANTAPAYHIRHRIPKDGDGPRWTWDKPKFSQLVAYGAWRVPEWLAEAEAKGAIPYVFVCESEMDALTLWHHGVPAVALGGAEFWRPEWLGVLLEFQRIIVCQEPDVAGERGAVKVAQEVIRQGDTVGKAPEVCILPFPDAAKDANAVHLAVGGEREAYKARMQQLLAGAVDARAVGDEQRQAEINAAWEKARSLLVDPKLLKHIEAAVQDRGYAGDTKPPMLVYLALTSRLTERPANIAVVAQSSAGKNRTVDAALELMPPTAYHLERAGSARALIYGDEDYQHKVVVIAEADSIPEDGPAASAIRALAADNVMSYDVVEKHPETGAFYTRHIEKPGPTGLITTSTRPLPGQMNTRVLTVAVSDTKEATRAVLHAHATAAIGGDMETDVTAFIALQEWLQLAGAHPVVVPFAHALADLVPNDLVRMRRDFRQLLSFIQASALLHQCQRERDERGRIVATLEDYQAIRPILLHVFNEVATGGVNEQVRETVAAVQELTQDGGSVKVVEVARHMGMNKDTIWHRVRRALDLGYLVNREDRKGQPAKLEDGDPLPESHPALPERERILAVYHPESHSTIQPIGVGISGIIHKRVESALSTAIQPPFSTDPPVSEGARRIQDMPLDNGDEATVERLKANREGKDEVKGEQWREAL